MKQLSKSQNRIIAMLLALAILLGMVIGAPTAAAYETKYGKVTGASSLNVRSGPGTGNTSIGYVTEGQQVTIVGEVNASDGKLWYQIEYADTTGYVSSGYIVLIETDADFEASIAAFPESYKDDLRKIHALYPDWVFEAVPTGTTWAEALEAECALGISLVASTSISSWKSTQDGAYDWDTGKWVGLDGSSWVQASEELVAYYLDPRSYLDENYIFTFLDYGAYDPEQQTVEGLERVMAGTFMANDFTENDTTYSYADVLMDVAEETGMNPYVLAAMIRIEIGPAGTSGSISGTVSGYEGYYNYYNIGAYAHSGRTAIQNGLLYAKSYNSTKELYNRPWNSRAKALLGGALFFKINYVDKGQDTIYLKKFNVVDDGGGDLYKGQYMTNIRGAALEGKTLSDCFDEDARQEALVFKIPVFQDMPETACQQPKGDGSPNNKLAALSVEGYGLTPAFDADTLSYELVVDSGVSAVTISAKAKDSTATISGIGAVTLTDGTNLCQVTVTAENGMVRVYEIEIAAEIDGTQTPPEEEQPKQPTVSTGLTIDQTTGYVHGLATVPMTAAALKAKFAVTDGTVVVLDKNGNAMADTANVGTGATVRILDATGATWAEYTVLIYGDATGDGKINSVDLLKIQKYILKLDTLDGVWLAAADGKRDSKVNSVDLLKIQKCILKLDVLEQ